MNFTSTGILHYNLSPLKLIVEVDQGIIDFYRSLIPKAYNVVGQAYRAHISVIRKETPLCMEHWGKYEKEVVEFSYDNDIKMDRMYCWLNVQSKRFEEIRLELGLTRFRNIKRLENEIPCFHMTIGNFKHLL